MMQLDGWKDTQAMGAIKAREEKRVAAEKKAEAEKNKAESADSGKSDWDALEGKALTMFEKASARALAQDHRTPSERNESTTVAARMLKAFAALRAQRQAENPEKPNLAKKITR